MHHRILPMCSSSGGWYLHRNTMEDVTGLWAGRFWVLWAVNRIQLAVEGDARFSGLVMFEEKDAPGLFIQSDNCVWMALRLWRGIERNIKIALNPGMQGIHQHQVECIAASSPSFGCSFSLYLQGHIPQDCYFEESEEDYMDESHLTIISVRLLAIDLFVASTYNRLEL